MRRMKINYDKDLQPARVWAWWVPISKKRVRKIILCFPNWRTLHYWCLRVRRRDYVWENKAKIGVAEFERVRVLKCLETLVTDGNAVPEEINVSIASGDISYSTLQPIFSSHDEYCYTKHHAQNSVFRPISLRPILRSNEDKLPRWGNKNEF